MLAINPIPNFHGIVLSQLTVDCIVVGVFDAAMQSLLLNMASLKGLTLVDVNAPAAISLGTTMLRSLRLERVTGVTSVSAPNSVMEAMDELFLSSTTIASIQVGATQVKRFRTITVIDSPALATILGLASNITAESILIEQPTTSPVDVLFPSPTVVTFDCLNCSYSTVFTLRLMNSDPAVQATVTLRKSPALSALRTLQLYAAVGVVVDALTLKDFRTVTAVDFGTRLVVRHLYITECDAVNTFLHGDGVVGLYNVKLSGLHAYASSWPFTSLAAFQLYDSPNDVFVESGAMTGVMTLHSSRYSLQIKKTYITSVLLPAASVCDGSEYFKVSLNITFEADASCLTLLERFSFSQG